MNKLRFVLSPLLAIALVLGLGVTAVQSGPGGGKSDQATTDTAGPPSDKGVQPVLHEGNKTCAELVPGSSELKVEPVREGTFTADDGSGFQVTISNLRGDGSSDPEDRFFDWASNQDVNAVAVKGGTNTNLFDYPAPDGSADSDGALHAPVNKKGTLYALSHVSFCYGAEEPPPPDTCPTGIALTPAEDTNQIGDDHTVVATVVDADGNACPGVQVRFEVDSDGNPAPQSAVEETDENGQASFTYTNGTVGTDTITACTGDDGTAPAACDDGTVTISATAQKTWIDEPVVDGSWSCRASALRVEDVPVVNTLLGNPFEPVVANADQDPCVTDDDELLDVSQAGLTVRVLTADTDEENGADANASVAQVQVIIGAAPTVSAEVLSSSAQGRCGTDGPELESSSTVATVTAGATTLVNVTTHEHIAIPGVGTLHINEEEESELEDGEQITRRALWLETTSLGDVIVAESIADYHGSPCE